MRQKQAAEAKKLAAEQRQRSGLLKEQAKIREAEAAEKAANAERLKPPQTVDPEVPKPNTEEPLPGKNPLEPKTGDTTMPDPVGTQNEDKEILPDKEHNPEEEDPGLPKFSQDYTLSEEGEGENISGTKELRKDGPEDEETNAKRAKGLTEPTAE